MILKKSCPYLANFINPDCNLNPDSPPTIEQIDSICGVGDYLFCACYLQSFIPGSRQARLARLVRTLIRPDPSDLEKEAYKALLNSPLPTEESWGNPEHQRPFVEDPRKP